MATYTKPGKRYTTSDWHTANYALTTNSERGCIASRDVRQESTYLRNETDNRTKWDQLDTNCRLSERVEQVRDMKLLLENTIDKLDSELKNLAESIDGMEKCLLAWNIKNHINVENLVLREGRQGIDVVEDEVEQELKKEQAMLKAIKGQLQSKIDEGFERLATMQEIRSDTAYNLQNKNITLDIDIDQYNLTVDSAGVTYKPDPNRVEENTLTVEGWQQYCQQQQMRADQEIANSTRLRECILANIRQTDDDYNSQNGISQYALRKRIHEYEMALDELQYQKEKTQEEIAAQEAEINRLNAEIVYHKKAALKLAETRAENRTYRPNEELCRDNVQFGLSDECKQLEATLDALRDKMRQAQHALDCLEQNLHRINNDIQSKKNCLHIDKQCIALRGKLETSPPLSVTERNQMLVGGARNQSDILAF